jgi:drug/metabolite transporter (DMT)-like permease
VLNGKFARREVPERLMFYELSAALLTVTACFAIAPAQFVAPTALGGGDILWICVLAIGCTVVPQVLIIRVLRTLSPFTVAVGVNLEPVYALFVAAIAFPTDDHLTVGFYAGSAVLFALVLISGARKSRSMRAPVRPDSPPTSDPAR